MVFIGIAASAAIAWLVCRMAIPLGPRLGYVDRPDDSALKVHRMPAVPLGGVAILSGTAVGWWAIGDVVWGMLGLAAVVVLLGLLDDRTGLSPPVRLVAEAAVGVATLSLPAVPLGLDSPLEAVVAVSLVVLAINAVNLVDGLDGLAGSTALIAFLGVAALSLNRGIDPGLPLVTAGALAGFLLLNRHPARVFLGDNGAYLVGFLLAVTVMRGSPDGLGSQLLVASLVLGVFVVDLAATVMRRWLARRPMLSGDRGHLYDRLRDHGWSVPAVVAAAAGAQILFVAIAFGLEVVT